MNLFKNLDELYPRRSDGSVGEIVSVEIRILSDYQVIQDLGSFRWKRKTSACEPSVNAFHMHRGLVREIKERFASLHYPQATCLAISKLAATAVMTAYIHNMYTTDQHCKFELDIGTLPGKTNLVKHSIPTVWWSCANKVGSSREWREVVPYNIVDRKFVIPKRIGVLPLVLIDQEDIIEEDTRIDPSLISWEILPFNFDSI